MDSSKLLHYILAFFLWFALWGFIFFNTIYASSTYVYIIMAILFVSFGFLWIKKGRLSSNSCAIVWMPFLLYTTFCWFLNLKLEFITYFFSCMSIILIAGTAQIRDFVPTKILIYGGAFALLGIIIQIGFPSLYYAYINPLFLNTESLKYWMESEYGFAGFTYQLDTTANILLFAEAAWLYMSSKFVKKNNRPLFWIVLFIFIIGIFLTGKRTHSAMSVLIPITVYLISRPNLSKSFMIFIILGLIALTFGAYFVSHANEYTDSMIFNRFANSVLELQAGEDITSNRSALGKEALRLSGSFWGIGVGEFRKHSIYGMDAHQTYYQVLCEQGIIGFILFVFPLFFCFIKTIKKIRFYKGYCSTLKMSLFIQIYFILYSFTGNTLYSISNYFLYFFAIALLVDVCVHGKINSQYDKKNISTL